MKNIILFLVLLSSALHANQEKMSSLYYVKLGANKPPGDSSIILPNFGLGTRFQKDCYGFDLSANLSSLVFFNYASLKGVFLFYPQPEKRNQLYFGIGPGVGYHINSIPLGMPFGCATTEYGNLTLEGVLGYEFRCDNYFKPFVQLELSQPIFGFGRYEQDCFYGLGVTLTVGFGF